jgi:hypothetical protein
MRRSRPHSLPSFSRRPQAGRPQPIAYTRCRFGLARPPQQQLAGRASGWLVFGRFPKALGFFRHSLFEGNSVLNAAAFHDAIPPDFAHPYNKLVRSPSVPFPTLKASFRPFIPVEAGQVPGIAENKARYPPLLAYRFRIIGSLSRRR